MDFDFSDDQQQLRDACARWVQRSYGFERRRQVLNAGGFSEQAWAELAELGLCALWVPAEHGGMGMGPVDAMVVLEEMGRGLVLEPLLPVWLASQLLAQGSDAALATRWLPEVASGQALVVLAAQERGIRYRWDQADARAECVAGQWRVSALKNLVPAGDKARAFIVSARHDQGLGLFLLDAQTPGVQVRGYATQDGSRSADLFCEGVPAQLLHADGAALIDMAQDCGAALSCALGVGMMEQALALTVEYMNTRRQFGVPIASFQALRHRVADMKMQLELARSMSYYASMKLHLPTRERRQAVSRAKLQLGQAMRFVGQQAVQLHGGIGVTDEYAVSHYFKALTQLEMSFGDSMHHLGQVSELMNDTAGVFS